jgi:hypothetical protein
MDGLQRHSPCGTSACRSLDKRSRRSRPAGRRPAHMPGKSTPRPSRRLLKGNTQGIKTHHQGAPWWETNAQGANFTKRSIRCDRHAHAHGACRVCVCVCVCACMDDAQQQTNAQHADCMHHLASPPCGMCKQALRTPAHAHGTKITAHRSGPRPLPPRPPPGGQLFTPTRVNQGDVALL